MEICKIGALEYEKFRRERGLGLGASELGPLDHGLNNAYPVITWTNVDRCLPISVECAPTALRASDDLRWMIWAVHLVSDTWLV